MDKIKEKIKEKIKQVGIDINDKKEWELFKDIFILGRADALEFIKKNELKNKRIFYEDTNSGVSINIIYDNRIMQDAYLRLEQENEYIEYQFNNGEEIEKLIKGLKRLYEELVGFEYEE